MQRDLNGGGGRRASIPGKPFFPAESPMSTLGAGFERWSGRLRMKERFRGPNGDQDGLRSEKLDEGPSELTAWPIAPAHRLSRNGKRGWCLFRRGRRLVRLGNRRRSCWGGKSRRRGTWPEDGAHPARLLRGSRLLTLFAQGTGATRANAGCIQHAQRAVALRPPFLQIQRMACRATERSIGLRRPCRTGKSMRKGGLRECRWPGGRTIVQRVLRCLGRSRCFRRGRERCALNGSGFGRGRSGIWGNGRRRSKRREGHHRKEVEKASAPANRPGPSRASWSDVGAVPILNEASRSLG